MKYILQISLILTLVVLGGQTIIFAQPKQDSNAESIKCSGNESPFRDFDFIIGQWDFKLQNGRKMGVQRITSRGEGCAIVEEWTEVSGISGVGVSFVDPETGLWRQVWMSSRFHIDYSGGLNEAGAMVLEGMMYPTNAEVGFKVRGVWTKYPDGSIKKEFLKFDESEGNWIIFFSGFAHPKKG